MYVVLVFSPDLSHRRQPPMEPRQRQCSRAPSRLCAHLDIFGHIYPDLTSPSTHGMHKTYEGGWNVAPFLTRSEMKGCRIGTSTLCFPLQVTSVDLAMGVLMMQV